MLKHRKKVFFESFFYFSFALCNTFARSACYMLCMTHEKNMNRAVDINTLVCRVLTGEATSQERDSLATRLREDKLLRKQYARLLNERELSKRYVAYTQVDLERAKSEGRKLVRHFQTRHVLRVLAGVAATVAVVVVVVANMGRRKPELPKVSKDMYVAMNKAEMARHTEAVLTINGINVGFAGSANALDSIVSGVARKEGESKGNLQAHVETLHGKEFWMTLEDGTIVHLNYNSSLTYPVRFGDERRVRLHGEAYFIVAHDASRPFTVETSQGVVTDYGTEFDIVARNGCTEVTLVKGKVGVALCGGSEAKLEPGYKAEMKVGKTLTVEKADLAPIKAWNTGNYHFDGATLGQLMEVVARWYGKVVRFESRDARDALFTGDLDKYGSPVPAFHAISAITGCKIAVENDTIVIK